MPDIKSSHLYQFLSALREEWVPIATGSGIVALIALTEHYLQRTISWLEYETVMVVFVGWSAYRVWNKQQDKIKALQVKPYDEARGKLAQQKLQNLNLVERDFLRYILLHPGVAAHTVNAHALIDVGLVAAVVTKLTREDLVHREDDIPHGWVRYTVAESWAQMFRDGLFPRNEAHEPTFREL